MGPSKTMWIRSDIEDDLAKGAAWWNQFATRFRAKTAKWSAQQEKDVELLGASINALYVAFRQLLEMLDAMEEEAELRSP
jgi:hypothetical protein